MRESTPIRFSERKIFKVTELTGEIRGLLEDHFLDLWVEGEISDLRSPRSGHIYFTLKDRGAKIKAVLFKSHMRFLRCIPKESDYVLIRGHLSLYEPRGEYQVICDYIEPRGAGALQAAFEALKEKLRSEGLFSEDRKQPLPALPSRIGVITSATGAAIQDILKITQSDDFRCNVLLYPVSVQGIGAASEIAKALDEMNSYSAHAAKVLDLLILARGGGSIEDLWSFNEESVARAIARSDLPVISAVGHESDTTIADYVADIRAPTPSAAANIVIRNGMASEERYLLVQQKLIEGMNKVLGVNKDQILSLSRLLTPPSRQTESLRNQVHHLNVRLHQAINRLLEERRGRLNTLRQGLVHLSPINRLGDLRSRLDQLYRRFVQEGHRVIADKKVRLQAGMDQLNLVSPLNILERGYSITRKLPNLEVVRNSVEVDLHDELQITLHQGRLTCIVEKKEVS